ncbi:MAG: 8-amino-7-oxononanoate synthase [Lentisphaerae bacterium]|nr:8-amino-7-oxononanoate synthase [Lentisphaerota bacterium]
MNGEEWVPRELASLRERDLERRLSVCDNPGGRITVNGKSCLNFSSNDYLDLARNPEVAAGAADYARRYGVGAGASRLVSGTLPCHVELETRLAEWKQYPAALLFGTGYQANLGAITALVGRNDHVFADRLAHASILDATVLGRATLHRFNHNEPAHLRELVRKCRPEGRRLVVTESVFSMDGDLAPLEQIADVCRENNLMLMVDEAHATGIMGPGGAGLVRHHELTSVVNVSMGTLSKGLGGYGGFVATSMPVRDLLVNRARALIYTTAPPPPAIGSAMAAMDCLDRDPGRGQTLLENAKGFRNALADRGLDTGDSQSQIIPLLVGDSARALSLSSRLRQRGLLAIAIRPPTVPAGTARIRLSVTLAHSEDDLADAADTIADCAQREGLL